MEIKFLTTKDNLWDRLIDYANSCDWEAGPILAKKMEENNFLDWERVFIATENDKII